MGVRLLPILAEDACSLSALPNMIEFLSCLILHRKTVFIRFRFGV